MLREMADVMMPRSCLVCGRRLGAHERHLCIWCAADLPLTYYWEQKHNPMADEFNALLERLRPEGEPMEYACAAALLLYQHDNPYKQIPKALKYDGNREAGRFFAAQLGKYLSSAPHFADVDTVIPVPLHWFRRWRRGYNQAGVIAEELSLALGARYCPDALRRGRCTRSQTSLDASERFRNVSGVFRPGRMPSDARHILLVDDTFTTGATLAACWQTVRKALGPGVRISVATLSAVNA